MYINKYKIKPRPSNKVQFIVLKADVLPAFRHATQIKSFFSFFFSPFFDIFVYLEEKKNKNISDDKKGENESRTQKASNRHHIPVRQTQNITQKMWAGFFFFPLLLLLFLLLRVLGSSQVSALARTGSEWLSDDKKNGFLVAQWRAFIAIA